MQVQDHHSQFIVHFQHQRSSPVLTEAGFSFANPVGRQQFFHDHGDCALLQAGETSQIGPRNRPSEANEFKDDGPVGISRGFAACGLDGQSWNMRQLAECTFVHRAKLMNLPGPF